MAIPTNDTQDVDELVTADDLEALRDEYASLLLEVEALEEEAQMVDAEYSDALSDWEASESVSNLVVRKKNATEKRDAQIAKRDKRKKNIREKLTTFFEQTGSKFPFGADDDTFVIQERLDWEYDTDTLITEVMLRGFKQVLDEDEMMLMKDGKPVDLTADAVERLLLFMRLLLSVDIAKGTFRKLVSSVTEHDRTVNGDAYVEIDDEWSWLPLEFRFKPTPVVGESKLLVWAENRLED